MMWDFISIVRNQEISLHFEFGFHCPPGLDYFDKQVVEKLGNKPFWRSTMKPPPDIFVVWRHKHSLTHACICTQFEFVCHRCENRWTTDKESLTTQQRKTEMWSPFLDMFKVRSIIVAMMIQITKQHAWQVNMVSMLLWRWSHTSCFYHPPANKRTSFSINCGVRWLLENKRAKLTQLSHRWGKLSSLHFYLNLSAWFGSSSLHSAHNSEIISHKQQR